MTIEDAPAAQLGVRYRTAALTRLAPGESTGATGGIVFDSRGVVLVVGDDADIMRHAAVLADSLAVVVCAPGAREASDLSCGVVALAGRVVSISGRLGAFTARAATALGASADIGGFGPNPDRTFDLVLDLSHTPHFAQAVPPLGYFAPGTDPVALADALTRLPALIGRFAKPHYFEYTPALCTHGAKELAGCTRCLDVCGAAAIRSAGNVIAVDPYLCQGCASCTLACPTGALAFRNPGREALLALCTRTIGEARAAGVPRPVLVVHTALSADAIRGAALPAAAWPIEVAALPAFGEELWLAALAQGAAGVVLVADSSLPPDAFQLLGQRVSVANGLVGAVAPPAQRIAVSMPAHLFEAVESTGSVLGNGTGTALLGARVGKRALILAALDTLTTRHDRPPRTLPAESPWGQVVVDRAKCTVCHACVNLCPTSALVATAAPLPRLSFVEANCVQCGLCKVGCPEAITLQPRFVSDPEARNSARLLHEDELARCTACSSPFVGSHLLASSLARVKDFPGLSDAGGIERLKLCPACRQLAAMDIPHGS